MTTPKDVNAICRTDAVTLAARIRAQELSATEVTDAVLRRMAVLEPHIHAFCTPTPDLARETAAAIDRRIAAGAPVGPLAGVAVGIKELVADKGLHQPMG